MVHTAGTVVSGRYQLVRELARGGMGAVWEALHQQLDTSVAVKFMGESLVSDAEARARFEREAKAAARLRSPHVVQILDYGLDEGVPFIVMELLRGEDLRARLKRVGRLSLEEAAGIITQACKALLLAAEAGIIHRDLKPANIFLSRSGDDESVKILDFGVAKATMKQLKDGTSSGMLLGSPHYMSPEQARGGKTLDPRADVWSMAVILYQMLTGKKPFRGGELGDVIVKICTEPPPLLSELAPELPATLTPFFERALAKDRDERFQSAQQLAATFAAIVAQHLGLPEPAPSMSGSHPRMPDPAPVSGAASHAPAGTLTLATRSVSREEPRPRSLLPLVAVVVVVAGGGLWWGFGQSADSAPPVEPAAIADSNQASDTHSEAPVDTASSPETAAATATAATATAATPTTSASATASASAPAVTAKPPTLPRPKPVASPPAPKPKSGKDPILGF